MIKIEPKVSYIAAESDPEQNHYFFAYKIKIINEGMTTAQLIARHWIIMNARGQIREVRGEGVVGQQPVLKPGDSFEYTSFCPLETSTGSMKGSFEMHEEGGRIFQAEISEFDLIMPGALGLVH